MVLVRRIHKRNANIVVEANAEVLFAPTGDVGRWTNRFSQRVRAFSAAEAPVNQRPRWGHYGKPLKTTFTASTTFQPGRMRIYSAVGSTSPHAYYVDQGTGIYAGRGPYEAKVLPPWQHGGASLYERTWRPGGPRGRRVTPVMIRGQKGQEFFDKGLKRGFESMRMRSFQVPGEGSFTGALAAFPEGLANFVGNTPVDAGFLASLKQWREWRDAAWEAHEGLGRGGGIDSRMHRRAIGATLAAQAQREAALSASRAAAARRAAAQARALAAEKARKAKAKAEREAKAHDFAVENERRIVRITAQKYANRGYTNVRLSTAYNAAHTSIIGFDLHYTDTAGVSHVRHFHI